MYCQDSSSEIFFTITNFVSYENGVQCLSECLTAVIFR
jgi:hypothetical protein